MFLRKINKLYMLCTIIMMVIITNSAYTQIIVNTCPATTGDLTARVTSSAPSGTTVTYHTGTPATDANKFTGDATAAPLGTYYAAYYDAINSCYSPTSMPLYVAKCVQNICPATTADLTSSVSSTPPAGTTVTYHTGTPATDANKVANPTSVSSGTYFASYYDATNSCYSPTSTPIVVAIETCGSTISGTVLNDTNGLSDDTVNGTGLGNPDSTPLYVNLIDSSGNVVATTPVNADGTYSLENVPNGDYTVQVTTNQGTVGSAKPNTELPTGWTNTGEKTGTGTGDDGTPNGEQTVNVSGSDVSNVKFGINKPATISGTVTEDTNGDTNGNTALEGVTITLKDSNGDTVKDIFGNDLTTTTAADGSYTFENVPAGSYTIEKTDPTGYTSVKDGDITNPSDDTPANTNTNDNSIPVTVTAGETDNGNNFVSQKTGSISGTVTEDTTGNGVGDINLGGVTLNLLDSNGDPVTDANGDNITTTTNTDGTYTFENIPPGTGYQIQEIDPSGLTSSSDNKNGVSDGTNDNKVTGIDVVAGQDTGGNSFVDVEPVSISGNVSSDTTGDNNTDTNLSGVTINLLNSNNSSSVDLDGNVITTNTDTDGNYSFTNIPPGNYIIEQVQPLAHASTGDTDGNSTENKISVAATTPGQSVTGQNFTEQLASLVPVTLVQFNAVKSGNNVLLSWATATEENNAKFIVEYSFNGIDFEKLSEVKGSGTTNRANSYSTIHKAIAESNIDKIYYRLTQVDFDGKMEFVGDIVHVNIKANSNLLIYPVPAQIGTPIMIMSTFNKGEYKVLSTSGQVVLSGDNIGDSISLNTSYLSSGVYIVQFKNGETVQFIIE